MKLVMMPVTLRKRSVGALTSSFPTSSMYKQHIMTRELKIGQAPRAKKAKLCPAERSPSALGSY
jgi:hypothetical protein